MATVSFRMSEKLEQSLDQVSEDVKKNNMGGIELNVSSTIRCSLEMYVQKYWEEKEGTGTLKVNPKGRTLEELEIIMESLVSMEKKLNEKGYKLDMNDMIGKLKDAILIKDMMIENESLNNIDEDKEEWL